jgi:flagellar biosynthesis/type III secretory pathway chaperone
MTDANQQTGTALALNSDETLQSLKKQVQDEFVTSDKEVYKEGLRSLLVQKQKLLQQIATINDDIKHIDATQAALDEAFKAGTLHSVQDLKGVIRTVSRSAARAVSDAFEG